MSQKMYFLVCSTVYFAVAAAHLTRLIFGWEIAIAGWTVPQWVSFPGLIVPGVLSTWGFVLAVRSDS
jgi:hypothetical protein